MNQDQLGSEGGEHSVYYNLSMVQSDLEKNTGYDNA